MDRWTAVGSGDRPVDKVENQWGGGGACFQMSKLRGKHCFEDQLLTIISNGVVLFTQYTKRPRCTHKP